MLKRHRLEGKLSETRIRSSWSALVGPHIDKYTERVTLRGSQLTVYLRSSVLRNELAFAREKLVAGINEDLGKDLVSDILFM